MVATRLALFFYSIDNLFFFLADVDECAGGNGSCPSDYECVNTVGSYRCRLRCPRGFVMTHNETCIGNYYTFLLGYCVVGVPSSPEIGVVHMMLRLLLEMPYH